MLLVGKYGVVGLLLGSILPTGYSLDPTTHHGVKYDNSNPHTGDFSHELPFHHIHQTHHDLEADDGYSHIRIIFTNDIHAHEEEFSTLGSDCKDADMEEHTCYGGAGRRQTIINRLRAGYKRSLLFDAGDVFQGHAIYNYYRGNASAVVMNAQRYDAMTIGNHEFDDGLKHLANFFEQLEFPVICTNLNFDKVPRLAKLVKKHMYLEEYNIAVVGVTTTTTQFISMGEELDQVEFLDAAEAVQAEIDLIREKYPNILSIFLLSHNGYLQDQDLASKVSGLSFIFGGHSHTYLSVDHPHDPDSRGPYPTAVLDKDNKPVYIVQAKKFGEYVGFVDLTLNQEGRIEWLSGQPVHMSDKIPQDPDMQTLVNTLLEPLHSLRTNPIGKAIPDMRQELCKTGECLLGNMVTQAILDHANEKKRVDKPEADKVDIVLINSDVMRAGIRRGIVYPIDIVNVFPTGNELVEITMTGQEIRQAIEASVTEVSPVDGKKVTGFLQVAGLKVEYEFKKALYSVLVRDPRVPLEKLPNGQVDHKSLKGWKQLDDDTPYTVLATNFLSEGGDHIFPKSYTYHSYGRLSSVLLEHVFREPVLNPKLDHRLYSPS
ncbi:hypothetical protein IWQ62_004951 [Dispira parvispora]|uniref:5'-nucleotidase n=1 Tax=Dispira parvispora TaxID=1520584 RepID=A0A9W8E049_9FUNG|nr:hypothetical protein IWQ62_004951 [Dispira parvispora]